MILNNLRPHASHASRSGSALVVALIAVMTIAALCAALLQVSGSASKEHSTSIDNLRALYIAEAGLAEAFNGLYAGKDGEVGTPEIPAAYGGGVYWVEAEEQIAGVVLMKSTGLYRSGRRRIQLAVEIYEPSPLSLGVFGDKNMTIGDGATITSFGSAAQPFSQFEASVAALTGLTLGDAVMAVNNGAPLPNIGSNKDISVGKGATIVANLVPGKGRVADIGRNTELMGTASPRTEKAEMPILEIPVMVSSGDLTITTGTPVISDGSSMRMGNLTVQTGGSLTIRGPADIVLDSFTLENGAKLSFDSTNGDIRLFVNGNFMLKTGSTVANLTEDTAGVQLLLYGTDDPNRYDTYQQAQIELGATSEFYGYVYAPNSGLQVTPQFHVIGGIAGRALTLADNARVSLDYSLSNTGAQSGQSLVPLSWSVQPLPEEALVVDRRDPMIQLQEQGVSAVKSANAHHIQGFRIKYNDADGVRRKYKGAEAMFDWSAVATINKIWREGETTPFPGPIPISPAVQAKADAIKALKPDRDKKHKKGKRQWWRKRRWD